MELTKSERNHFNKLFELADDNEATMIELDRLEGWQEGITKQLFGTDDESIVLGKAKDIRKMITNRLEIFLGDPQYHDQPGSMGLPKFYKSLSIPKTYRDDGAIEAVDFTHNDLCKICLKRTGTVGLEFYIAQNEGYSPSNKQDAINFDPQNKSGSSAGKGNILPYFKSTRKTNISLEDWVRQPIMHAISWYHIMCQELVAGYNKDLISLFDERVPSQNVIHVPNKRGVINQSLWHQASNIVQGDDQIKGIAIYDGAAMWDLPYFPDYEDIISPHSDHWDITPLNLQTIVRVHNQRRVALSGFVPIINDMDISSNNQNVRFFPMDYGYFVPLLLNGDDKFLFMDKLIRNDVNFGGGNLFLGIQLTQIGAIQIVGHKNSAMIRSE